MFKLLVLLGGGLFLALLIVGRDSGQQRLGLQGAYDIAVLKDDPLAPAEPTPVVSRAEPAPLGPATAVSYSPAPEPEASEAPVQTTLTLALPLVTADPPADTVQAAAPLSQVHYVVGSNVNVRDAASAKAAVLDRLSRGEAVTVLGSDTPGWSMIRIEGDGIEGFVATRYLSASPPDGATSRNSD